MAVLYEQNSAKVFIGFLRLCLSWLPHRACLLQPCAQQWRDDSDGRSSGSPALRMVWDLRLLARGPRRCRRYR